MCDCFCIKTPKASTGCFLYCTEIAYTLGNPNKGVSHILFVFQTYRTLVTYFAKHLDEEGEIDDSTSNLGSPSCLCRSRDILQVKSLPKRKLCPMSKHMPRRASRFLTSSQIEVASG